MAVRKVKKIEEKPKEEKEEVAKYFYAVGRRKTSIAKIKLFPSEDAQSALSVNDRSLEKYFPLSNLADLAKSPLDMTGENKFSIQVKVSGGGVSSQAEAIRLGVSRALIIFDETLKKSLKDKGYLTRNPRKVERKKPGLKKARRAPQWQKR
jgi:small subunit ribosomal protein S9